VIITKILTVTGPKARASIYAHRRLFGESRFYVVTTDGVPALPVASRDQAFDDAGRAAGFISDPEADYRAVCLRG
jgi:hypothetical protein